MMTGAGLFLRESLYQRHPPQTEQVKAQSVRRKSYDSNNASSSITTVFNFVDFVVALTEVSSENLVFVELIKRIRQDVSEALRLHTCDEVTRYFEKLPDRKSWVDSTLLDIQRALNDIGAYLESVGVGGDDGGAVKMKRRFEWVLSHHQKLISRELALNTCHQSLMAAIQLMQAIEVGGGGGESGAKSLTPPPIFEAPGQPPQEGGGREILRSPYSRKKWRMSGTNLSLPNITISEIVTAKPQDSGSSSPVELPGSTPEDLPDPDNWDLYAPPTLPRRSFHHVSPLPTLREKTEECYELLGSLPVLPKSRSIPILARRYRAKAIQVRKPFRKHHSLPVRLPSVQRQTSLYIELAEYILSKEETQNEEPKTSSPDVQTPSSTAETSSVNTLQSVSTPSTSPETSPSDLQPKVEIVCTTFSELSLRGESSTEDLDDDPHFDGRVDTSATAAMAIETLSSSTNSHAYASPTEIEPSSSSTEASTHSFQKANETSSSSTNTSAHASPATNETSSFTAESSAHASPSEATGKLLPTPEPMETTPSMPNIAHVTISTRKITRKPVPKREPTSNIYHTAETISRLPPPQDAKPKSLLTTEPPSSILPPQEPPTATLPTPPPPSSTLPPQASETKTPPVPDSTTSTHPPQESPPKTSPPPPPPPTQVKPLTSQTKRMRAHARRLEIAYGDKQRA